jgi:SAM-dependent methyltransferase
MQTELQFRTRAHYDEYPFIEGGPNRVRWWHDYLSDFLPDADIRDKLVLDDGSSVGEISRGLIDRGARMACLDISLQSLRRCRVNNHEADVLNGSALELPFPDASFDHAISIGVLHHTPDCRRAFRELARVAAPGARIVVFLYNYWNIYNALYHGFAPIRAIMPVARIPRAFLYLLQPFARLHLGQKLSDKQLRNLLGDKLWTPQATFHSVSQVRKWGLEDSLTLIATKKFFLAYANVFCFRKHGKPIAERRDLTLQCLSCGAAPMRKDPPRYKCGNCGREYPLDEGIVRCL